MNKTLAATFLVITGFLILAIGCQHQFIIDNPYEKVNWKKIGHYKADLHAHTSVSDGWYSPHVVIDRYRSMGYDIIALTDHNVQTYLWQEFSSLKASSVTQSRHEAGRFEGIPCNDIFVYENRDPSEMNMVAVQANELSQHHHLGSYYNNEGHYDQFVSNYFNIDFNFRTATVEESLEIIAEKNGLAVLFHPGSYSAINPRQPYHSIDWYVDLFQRYGNLVGMEVYNSFIDNPTYMNGLLNQSNIQRWDSVLTRTMPGRPVWGFANDDFHFGEMGISWNVFLLPDLVDEEVRSGIGNGLSYFIYAPEGHDGPSAPEINSIKVNSRKGTIHIEASGYHYIEWISDGEVIHKGNLINISDFPEIGGYVRANVFQSENGPLAGTQPFGINRK